MLNEGNKILAPVPFLALLAACVVTLNAFHASARTAEAVPQEDYCISQGWEKIIVNVSGVERKLFYKGPSGAWTNGAIIAMHGGSGSYYNFCYPSGIGGTTAMTNFANQAIGSGFGVLSLDSTNIVTDSEGRLCGKVWDDEVRIRPNVDLPFIEQVVTVVVPGKRPAGSAGEIFMTGISSGGFMTVRASTRYDDLVAAFAPVSAGDPYGWNRNCDPVLGSHGFGENIVHGRGYDNETSLEITQVNACVTNPPATYPNETQWETANPVVNPAFKHFHDQDDGIANISCQAKAAIQLTAHAYPNGGAYIIPGEGTPTLDEHFWQEVYNQPIINFFISHVAGTPSSVGGIVELPALSADQGSSRPNAAVGGLAAVSLLLVGGGLLLWGRLKVRGSD